MQITDEGHLTVLTLVLGGSGLFRCRAGAGLDRSADRRVGVDGLEDGLVVLLVKQDGCRTTESVDGGDGAGGGHGGGEVAAGEESGQLVDKFGRLHGVELRHRHSNQG